MMALRWNMPLADARRELARIVREYWLPAAAGMAVAMAALAMFVALRLHEDEQIERIVAVEGRYLASTAKLALESRALDVLALARRWEGFDDPPAVQWERDAQSLADRDPVFRAFEWRDAEFQAVRGTPATSRFRGAELDTLHDPDRVSAAAGIADRGAASASGSFRDSHGHRLIAIGAPMLTNGSRVGVMMGIVRSRDLIDAIVRDEVRRGYCVAVREGPYRVYGPLASIEGTAAERWSRSVPIEAGELTWTIDYWPSGELLDRWRSYAPPIVFVSGLFLASILASLVRTLQLLRRR